MANINKIRLSGQTYDIQDPNAQPLLTAGQGITIENNVISATGGGGGMDDNTQQLIATSLVDLNDRKADKTSLSKYQQKGDYATKSQLDAKANASDVMTLAKSEENEKITASALNNLNNKFGGMTLVKITESEYTALTTKDENTLYIVVADPS